jgi:hypothetical protein
MIKLVIFLIKNGDFKPFVERIYDLFIAHDFFYGEEELRCNIILIVLKRKNIFDICINIEGKYP